MQFINSAKQILKNMLLSACMAVSAISLVYPVNAVAGTIPGATVKKKVEQAPAKKVETAKKAVTKATDKKVSEKSPTKNQQKASDNKRQVTSVDKKDTRKTVTKQSEKAQPKASSNNRSSAVASIEKQDSKKTQAKNAHSNSKDLKQPQIQKQVAEKPKAATKQQTVKAEPVQKQKKAIVEKPVIREQTAQKGDIRSKPRDPRPYSDATKNAASKPSSGWTTSGVDTAAKSAYQERYADNVTPKVYAKEDASAPKEIKPSATVTSVEARSAVIDTTIFAAAQKAGIPDTITKKFTNLFSIDVDMDISEFRGSRFNLIYEVFRKDGRFIKTGNLLAAEFIHEGVHYQTIWFEKYTGQGEYYDVEGRSLKATTASMSSPLRTPLDSFRMSSGFGYRIHPVKGDLRQHKGLDMAAPTGTPIHAVAEGLVKEAGWHGGYGNFVLIQHTATHATAYAHMSRIHPNITAGSRVHQGEVIGYVGSTGISTGPHLHYEVRVNGIAQDPSKITGISGVSTRQNLRLSGNDLSRFKKHLYRMQSYFTQLNANPSKRISS